jgi:hypothetical protein
MKFDAARAAEVFAKLGEPPFAHAQGEARVADFVGAQLQQFGYLVERVEVEGSRFPIRAAPWVGWLGYAALTTAAYVLLLGKNARSGLVAVFIVAAGRAWLEAVLRNRIRWGGRVPPLKKAPLLIARAPEGSSAPVRVVFQAVLGGLKPDHLQAIRLNRTRLMILHAGFFLAAGLTVVTRLLGRPVAPAVCLWLATGFLVLLWLSILGILSGEVREARAVDQSIRVDRRGLTLLLELARCWPRGGSRPIEVIFVAAGGQQLDFAGSRAVIERLESQWPRKPSLLLVFFGPGAGEIHRLVPTASSSSGTATLARDAARSLWIPIRGHDPWSHLLFWPLERNLSAAEVIVLVGAHSWPACDTPFAPQVLDHAAQLATEIALRWAKKAMLKENLT